MIGSETSWLAWKHPDWQSYGRENRHNSVNQVERLDKGIRFRHSSLFFAWNVLSIWLIKQSTKGNGKGSTSLEMVLSCPISFSRMIWSSSRKLVGSKCTSWWTVWTCFAKVQAKRLTGTNPVFFVSSNVDSIFAGLLAQYSGILLTTDLGRHLGVQFIHERVISETSATIIDD